MSFSSFYSLFFFFFNDTATTEIYTLSLHDALPISLAGVMQEKLALVEGARMAVVGTDPPELASEARRRAPTRSEEHTSELQSRLHLVCRLLLEKKKKLKQVRLAHIDDQMHSIRRLD